MSENELRGIINCLKQISEYIDKTCEDLSAANDYERISRKLLNMCVKFRKNCEIFEEMILREETNVDSTIRSKNLVITLHLLDIIGEQNCRKLKNDQIEKFKADLDIFTKNYLLQTSDPVFVHLYQLHYSDIKAGNADSAENQEIFESRSGQSELREIFDSSSTELTPEESSSQNKKDVP